MEKNDLWTKVPENLNDFEELDGSSPLRGQKMLIAEIPEA